MKKAFLGLLAAAALALGASGTGDIGSLLWAKEILPDVEFQLPPNAEPTHNLSDALKVLGAFKGILSQSTVASAAKEEILKQLRENKPIAFVNGYWVTLVDLSSLYKNSTVRTALLSRFSSAREGNSLLNRVGADLSVNLTLAFTPLDLASTLGIPTQDFLQTIGVDAFQTKVSSSWLTGSKGGKVVLGALIDVAVDIIKAIGRAIVEWIDSWGDEGKDEVTCPDCDPDNDGIPNKEDTDDDGDGRLDEEDTDPYDPEKFACVIITCLSDSYIFGNLFTHEISTMIQTVATNVLRAYQTSGIASLGSVGSRLMPRATLEVAFPPQGQPGGSPIPVEIALDLNQNDLLDDAEILQAIQLWIKGEAVPGTEQTLSDEDMTSLIRLWIAGESLSGTAS